MMVESLKMATQEIQGIADALVHSTKPDVSGFHFIIFAASFTAPSFPMIVT